MSRLRVAVVGGGWAGLAAAITAVKAGHQVSVWEAAAHWGGRARALAMPPAAGLSGALDNGQHILIGAYTSCLALMRSIGTTPTQVLQAIPLTLCFPDGTGLRLPKAPPPLDVLAGIALAKGWSWSDKAALLRTTLRWRLNGFRCDPQATVADLCADLPPTVMRMLIDPLCVSALNTPTAQASGAVFLRVLHDALLGPRGSSQLLLPRTDLGAVFPEPASRWLAHHGAHLHLAERVSLLEKTEVWRIATETFDRVVLACGPSAASHLLHTLNGPADTMAAARAWANGLASLRYEAIATVYVWAPGVRLAQPLLALPSDANRPAQFVLDRGQLGGPAGLLAFVVSASQGDRASLQQAVLQQARTTLPALAACPGLRVIQTVVEKRATFACTPGLQRPSPAIAEGLSACGDYLDGPYPATLEAAVRSGMAAALAL